MKLVNLNDIINFTLVLYFSHVGFVDRSHGGFATVFNCIDLSLKVAEIPTLIQNQSKHLKGHSGHNVFPFMLSGGGAKPFTSPVLMMSPFNMSSGPFHSSLIIIIISTPGRRFLLAAGESKTWSEDGKEENVPQKCDNITL